MELEAALHQISLLGGDTADLKDGLSAYSSIIRAAAFLEFECIGGADREQVLDTGVLKHQVIDVDAPILAAGDVLSPLTAADG